VGPFVVDFCCPQLRLVIELDGGIHDEMVEQDAERTRLLEASGYKVVRFKNDDVLFRQHEVVDEIVRLTYSPVTYRHS
jgi:very-short-patch-repair endonuclease